MLTDFRTKAMAALRIVSKSGQFIRIKGCGRWPAGTVAGGVGSDGYILIGFAGKQHRAHRLAWLFMTGVWPPKGVEPDHENRIRTDNRWSNLRIGTRQQNCMNASLRSDNSSGCKGVSYRKDTGKWHARVYLNGKAILLGDFTSINDAISVRMQAEQTYFGEFAARASLV